ncbi:unnamed protein product [Clonostachys chloroleuca]|uniref:Cupin type-1 domain-containing protein n=1 Tax=Clonostachys chloroleuca TaxID=1926264 RepID=A0AA35MD18_9HYPO|nr:unnamed protein product [Clonostachys chloroleuca]
MGSFQIRSLAVLMLGVAYVRSATPEHHLQLTAVVSDKDQNAAFECWEFSTAFTEYPTVGSAVNGLADVSNISYVILPPRSGEGLHKPPHPMFFALLSGSAHITLPEGDDELWIRDGENGLIVAVDTVGVGHYTEYPSDIPAIALQIPFKDGVAPTHRVIKHGPCSTTASDSKEELTLPRVFEELK